MNENGYSWPEAILTLTIVLVIFGTLLPFGAHLSSNVNDKKLAMHAMEAAFKGAIIYQAFGQPFGTIDIEDVLYEWEVSGEIICISYSNTGKVETRCVG